MKYLSFFFSSRRRHTRWPRDWSSECALPISLPGKAPSLPRGVSGADNMARLMVAVWPRLAGIGVSMEPRQVNAHPGILVRDPAGKVLAVLALEIGNGQIHLIRSVINPDKLAHLGPVADAWSLQEAYRRRGRA